MDSLLLAAMVCATAKPLNVVVSNLQNCVKALKNYDITSDVLTTLFHNLDINTLIGKDGKMINSIQLLLHQIINNLTDIKI